MPSISIGTIYLAVAAVLIFGACFFAAKKAFPNLQGKQFALIVMIALLMVDLIWMLLSVTARRPEAGSSQHATEPSPLLQPNPD